MGMGSLSKIASMIPGIPAGMLDGNEEETSKKLKQIVYVTDAMTARELDGDGSCFVSASPKALRDRSLSTSTDLSFYELTLQIRRDKSGTPVGLTKRVWKIAQGSGTSVRDVEE